MSAGNEKRNYQVFEDLYYSLVQYYRSGLQNRPERAVIQEVENYAIKIVDATMMTVSSGLFSWAKYRTARVNCGSNVLRMVECLMNIFGL